MKLYYIVVYEIFSILATVRSRSRSLLVTAGLKHLPQHKLSGAITQLWFKLGS